MKNPSIKKSSLIVLAIVGIVGAFGLGFGLGEKKAFSTFATESSSGLLSATSSSEIDLAPFWKSLDTLNSKFVATTASSSIPSDKEKVYGAITGLAASYGDPYTTFFPPKESAAFAEEVRGDFEGIGMEIGIKDNVLTVIAPLKGTPSEKAGMKPGDQVLKINKVFTNGMTVEDAVSKIRGPKGTVVTLTVKQSDGTTKDVPVTRDTIKIPTIDTKMRDDGVFVLSLYTFSANSANLFRDALREFILSGSDKLVLDLRGNPGGYLESAVDMASFFLPIGKTIVIEDNGTKEKQIIEKSRGYNVFTPNLKMVVLIDGGSASASEILAGALHEQGIAKLVGEKSFGKGSVQEVIEITPDTALKVTIAKWLTPSGHSISQNGLEPDVKVAITKKDIEKKFDSQMEKAAEILRDANYKL
ncbi:MAG: S41 family peptidase [Candidatus Paceibacterota bacterium]|jgi:carboxyl-terminal processing protease